MKTFNKKGDAGETSLLYGKRVPKNDHRCEAYGTIDEAVSMLGLARQYCLPAVNKIILSIQNELFIVGAELATPQDHYDKWAATGKIITEAKVQHLEDLIDKYEAKIKMPDAFIIPGGAGSGSATLDVARTIIRRAERVIAGMKQKDAVPNKEIPRYMNRLADLLFTLARYQETKEKKK